MPGVLIALLLALGGAVSASAQQLSAEQRDNLFKAQNVIADPAEYNAYLTAVITSDPAARIAALDAFLERFSDSAARDDVMDRTMDALVQLDNQNTALVRLHLRSMKLEPTPEERACQIFHETRPDTLSLEDWELILQYRDSGSPCNRDAAEKVWRTIQDRQKSSQGKPWIRLNGVRVLSATSRYIDAAVTDSNKKAGKSDLRITMAEPLAQPPAPGTAIAAIGFISDYSTAPFMFIMTHGKIVVARQSATVHPGRDTK